MHVEKRYFFNLKFSLF